MFATAAEHSKISLNDDHLNTLARIVALMQETGTNPDTVLRYERENKNRIEVSRKGKTQRFTLDDLKKDTSPEKKFWLEPGDVIYVHESFF